MTLNSSNVLKNPTTISKISSGRIVALLGAAAGLLALWVVYAHPPGESGFYPSCWWFTATGLYCPGCGGFRALHEILHGRIAAALSYNALLTIFSPPACAWFAWTLYRGRPIRFDEWTGPALALAVLFAAARNIPVYPFLLLAP